MSHQSENRTVPYTNASNNNNNNNHEINFTNEQKHLYSHRFQDIESGFKSQLTC